MNEKRTVHEWFGLTYSSWLTLPRVLLSAMPDEWQFRFTQCLDELDDTFDSMGCDGLEIEVRFKRDGKYVKTPDYVGQYRHPSIEFIEECKSRRELSAFITKDGDT